MIGLSRRTVITASAITAATTMLPAVARAASPIIATPPAAFLFDARRPLSLKAAHFWALRGVVVIDARQADLAQAWRDTLAPRLRERAVLAGLTPWSDQFICEVLCRDAGFRLRVLDSHGSDGLVEWQLS